MDFKQIKLRNSFVGIGMTLLLLFQWVRGVQAANPIVDLSLNQQDVVILGETTNGFLGEVDGSGDFNGDGKKDLLVGGAGIMYAGRGNSGGAYVILGSASLAPSINLATTPPNLRIYGAKAGDILGHSVAAGDVNGDGRSDIILGADLVDGSGVDRGAVYVILGQADGFASKPLIDLKSSPAALTILGGFDNGSLGRSVASGDINHDGLADIVIGAYTESPGGRLEAGSVYVVLGSQSLASGNPTTIDLGTQSAALSIYGASGDPDGVLNTELKESSSVLLNLDEVNKIDAGELGDRLGRSVAVGDVNGDGTTDVIAGAYGANVGSNVDAGKTYVFYGSSTISSSSPKVIDLSTNPGGANITLNGIDAGDQSGFYVGSGNLNHDGFSDILSGAYVSQGNGNSGTETGEVYAVYGGSALPSSINLATGASITVYGAASGDRLGRSLASGDVNLDGYDDLILGASHADPNGRVDAGEAYVIYGSNHLGSKILLSDPDAANMYIFGNQSTGDVCLIPQSDCSDEAGRAVSAGDINGDGVADIIVGAVFANNGTLEDAGAAYIIYGHGTPVSIEVLPATWNIWVGDRAPYQAIAKDAKGNTYNITGQTTFSISSGAGGSWQANVYNSQNPGTWTVTGRYGTFSDTATLTVSPHNPPVALTLVPATAKIWKGESIPYTAYARDANGVSWDATSATTFSIDPMAGGSWAGNVYTSWRLGNWDVTGRYQGVVGTAKLTVAEHGDPIAITVSPKSWIAALGEIVEYTVMAHDTENRYWDVTSLATFSIQSAAGGSWAGNHYTTQNTGNWTVTAQYQGFTDTGSLRVITNARRVYLPIQHK